MAHRCYISFKAEDYLYKREIQKKCDIVDKSLNTPINSDNEDYIMRVIRRDYLSDSTVTIFLIGSKSSEQEGWYEQRYIKRELQASLYNSDDNPRNGILGIVLPSMYDVIFKGSEVCSSCGGNHDVVAINSNTVIDEFGKNYYLKKRHDCYYSEDDRYCVLAKWGEFMSNPDYYIEKAFNKRNQSIADDVIVYP